LRATAYQGLTKAFQAALRIPFDDFSRFVFFSDCHRGVNSRTDAFAPNKGLFYRALVHYFEQGFTYFEVGDGDELWMNPRFSDVQRAHRPIFDLLHRFDWQDRLHLLVGNHDVASKETDREAKDGMSMREGLVLEHTRNGKEIMVVHGHQADFGIDPGFAISRFMVRHVWKRLQELGFGTTPIWAKPAQGRSWIEQQITDWLEGHKRKIEQRIIAWLEACEKAVICGHTHLPHFASPGTLPYFNAGSCVIPGHITGLEIESGQISLVRWSLLGRTLLAPPRKLSLLY
jgi:UDP-2,3-diacylglucosamine pyrophosphatase LpxH